MPLSLLVEHEITREGWLAPEITENHSKVIEEFIKLGSEHYSKAKSAIARLPKEVRNVFLPLVFVPYLASQIGKKKELALTSPTIIGPVRRQLLTLTGALSGRL